jgi:hypothetical protein
MPGCLEVVLILVKVKAAVLARVRTSDRTQAICREPSKGRVSPAGNDRGADSQVASRWAKASPEELRRRVVSCPD